MLEHGSDDLAAVMMPLSPHRMLVGKLGDVSVEISAFNTLAAPHCMSFFVGSRFDHQLQVLAKDIGRRATVNLQTALSEAAAELREPAEKKSGEHRITPAVWTNATIENVELTTDCLDQESCSRFSAILGNLLNLARARFDITSLRRIIVKADYEAALAHLDRGRFAGLESVPQPNVSGLSIAYNVNVEHAGVDGVVIVLRDHVAAWLISDDDESFGWGASAVLGQLARIGSSALIKDVYRNGISAGDQSDALLTSYSLPAWKTWMVARYAAMLNYDRNAQYRAEFRQCLVKLTSVLQTIRRDYRLHGDIEKLLKEACTEASIVLEMACASACHSATPTEDDGLEVALASLGLSNWRALLISDVTKIWAEGMEYPKQEAFLVLNQHLRRLLGLGGILIWEDNGCGKVEVPYLSDMEWMLAYGAEKL